MPLLFKQYRWLASLPLWLATCWAQAASLSINPVKITLDGSTAISAMTVTNQSDEAVVMQATINAWTIQNNKEVYQPTEALIVNPPIFELASGASQIVRVGLSDTTPHSSEQSFRVFLEQSPTTPEEPLFTTRGFMSALPSGPEPTAAKPTPSRAVQLMLRIGIPVFIQPPVAQSRPLEWSASRLPGRRIRIEAHNPGNLHVRVSQLSLMTAVGGDRQPSVVDSSDELRYLLPNSYRHWVFDAPSRVTAPYFLKVETNTGVLEYTIPSLTP